MEIPLTELGFLSEKNAKILATHLSGTTFMNFDVTYSNLYGNCTLIISTSYKDTEENIKNFFLSHAMTCLAHYLQITHDYKY